MLNLKTTCRSAAIAAITAAYASLPVASATRAQPLASPGTTYNTRHERPIINREGAKGQPAFQNFTWAEASPDYHGANGG